MIHPVNDSITGTRCNGTNKKCLRGAIETSTFTFENSKVFEESKQEADHDSDAYRDEKPVSGVFHDKVRNHGK